MMRRGELALRTTQLSQDREVMGSILALASSHLPLTLTYSVRGNSTKAVHETGITGL